jgi:hypothetical protein
MIFDVRSIALLTNWLCFTEREGGLTRRALEGSIMSRLKKLEVMT